MTGNWTQNLYVILNLAICTVIKTYSSMEKKSDESTHTEKMKNVFK